MVSAKGFFFLLLFFLTFSVRGFAQFIISGSYTGNGVDNRDITGLPFSPDVVIVKGDGGANAVIRTSLVTGDNAKKMDAGNWISNAIQSILVDGFQVGTAAEVNTSGKTYYFTAFANQTSSFTSGSYTGNGTNNLAVSGLGFQPDFVYILSGGSDDMMLATSDMTAGEACDITAGCGLTNRVNSLSSNGFTLGTHATTNSNGRTYYWFAGKKYSGVISVGAYAGNGVDNRNMSLGFSPDFLMLKENSNNKAVFRNSAVTGDTTLQITNGNFVSNYIQSFNGFGYQLGNNTQANENGKNYFFVAFGSSNNPLALNLLAFDLIESNNAVTANWIVSEEGNIAHYVLERSADGTNFSAIAEISARGSNDAQAYDYEDRAPLGGISWYRLRWLDATGQSEYSEKKAVRMENPTNSDNSLRIGPNPCTGSQFRVAFDNLDASPVSLQVMNLNGQVVYSLNQTESTGAGFIEVSVPNGLAPGMYFVQVTAQNQKMGGKLEVQY